jgi:hypothetical protein
VSESIIIHNTRFSRTLISEKTLFLDKNANPKRVKKITIWVGEKKGREEEDDDDGARMLDEFPPPSLSPLCKFLVEKGFYYKKIPETKSDQE